MAGRRREGTDVHVSTFKLEGGRNRGRKGREERQRWYLHVHVHVSLTNKNTSKVDRYPVMMWMRREEALFSSCLDPSTEWCHDQQHPSHQNPHQRHIPEEEGRGGELRS